jgi:hypothetical protein
MITALNDTELFFHKTFFETSAEFEEIRRLCLAEDNWLRDLYTPKNLIIEKHSGYSVVFHKDTNEPVGMAGVFNDGRYPTNVARHLHREYTFPKWRTNTRQGVTSLLALYVEHIIKPLIEINNFDVYFIAMQNRYKKKTKGYWEIFSRASIKVAPNWKIGDGYIQTCPFNVQKCWQNYIYCETVDGAFANWQTKIIFQDEWNTLTEGN